MPTYCYVHPKTTKIFDRIFPSDKIPKSVQIDGVRCKRCMPAEYASQGNSPPSCWPMKSTALAVHKTQTKEYEKFSRDHGVPTHFDATGHPEFSDKAHRKKYCELVGATDLDGGSGDPFCG